MDTFTIYNALTPDQIKRIKTDNNEDDDRLARSVEILEQWMDCHAFIPKNYEKQMLQIFLRSCKHDMEATKRKLELYFINKTTCPDSFKIYSFNESDWKTLNNFYFIPSANFTPEGNKVTFMGFRKVDPDACDIEIICKFIWIAAIYKANKSTLDAGNILVLDMKVFSPGMAVKMMVPTLNRNLTLLQTTFPFRTKRIFLINAPSYAENIINIVKMFLNDKMKNRLNIEIGDEQMKKAIPHYCIPSDLGGSGKSIKDRVEDWLRLLKHYEPWFKIHEKVQVIVEKIPKELYTSAGIDEDMGTEGSFRQLHID